MPNTEWSKLNNLQLGRYAELYAKMEFLSYGFDVYPAEVDDHGVDLLIKTEKGTYYEVQVKSVYKSKYVILKNESRRYLVCLMIFIDGQLPKMYLIPTSAWKTCTSKLFVDRPYEYGINVNDKNLAELEIYRFDKMIKNI